MRVLVTGGAGYIGSHILCHLRDAGQSTLAFDNLASGHRWAVRETPLVEGDLGDDQALEALFAQGPFAAVIHCAGSIWVGELMRDPAKYYTNNASNAFRLFAACVRHGVSRIVFSSTAAVYGEPQAQPIGEAAPLQPINPYGASKMMAERALLDLARAHGLKVAILRYFNVAGADAQARVGEATPDNSHLVKVACETAIGLRPAMRINGTDYPTPDGTCIRDYVHVADLAHAHLAALDHLAAAPGPLILNCGYGHGFSVREVVDAVRRVTGIDFAVETGPRRPGDPPALVADARRIREVLGWQPRHDDLDRIVRSAWTWERRLAAMRQRQGEAAA